MMETELPGKHSLPPGFPKGLRVMVVDDDTLCLKVVEQMLRKCDYLATTCINGNSALALLRERPADFDLVLCDVYMPDMDGFKLLETVGLELDLPVIMMSSNGETSTVLRGVTHGAVDFLIKPVRIEELRNVWQHVIRRRRELVKDVDSEEHSQECKEEVVEGGRKRKDVGSSPGDVERPATQDEEGNASKKPRVTWSVEMHQKFVAAVNTLGVDKAVPKKILEIMNVEGLTRENVASHLQKYRLYLKRVQGVPATTPRIKPSAAGQHAAQGPSSHSQQNQAAAHGGALSRTPANGHAAGTSGANGNGVAGTAGLGAAGLPSTALNGMGHVPIGGAPPPGGMLSASPGPSLPAGTPAPGADPFSQGGMPFANMLPGNPMGLSPLLPMGPLNPMNPMGMPGPLGMPPMPNPLGMLPAQAPPLSGIGPLGVSPLGTQLPGGLPGVGPLAFMPGMGMPPLGLANMPGMMPPGMGMPPGGPGSMSQQGLGGPAMAMQNGFSNMQLGGGPSMGPAGPLPHSGSAPALPGGMQGMGQPGSHGGPQADHMMGLGGPTDLSVTPGSGAAGNLQGRAAPGSGLGLDIPDLGEPLTDLLQGDNGAPNDVAALLHMDVSDMDAGELSAFPDLAPPPAGDGLGSDGKDQGMDELLNYFLKS